MTFAMSFNLLYHFTRRYFVGLSGLYSRDELQRMPYAQQVKADNWWGEFKALAVTGMLSMPFGILQFVPGYHFCKDALLVHAEVSTIGLGAIYGLILFYGLQHNRPVNYLEHGERETRRGDKRSGRGRWYIDEAFVAVCMHFSHYMLLVLFSHPDQLQVLGLHQDQGYAPAPNRTRDEDYGCDYMRNLTYPYPFTDGAFWPFTVSALPEAIRPAHALPAVTVWKRPYICPYGSQLFDEKVVDFSCEMARKQTWLGGGHMWYWICGTGWDSGDGSTSHIEYIIVIWGICLFGLNLYAQAFCYPRTLYEQFVELREFPRYYKTDAPTEVVVGFEGDRVNEDSGRRELLVARVDARTGEALEPAWVEKDELAQDAVGPVYGERGGMYGVLHDTYGKSTLDRIRTADALEHASARLNLFAERHRRRPVGGIRYDAGYPMAEEAAAAPPLHHHHHHGDHNGDAGEEDVHEVKPKKKAAASSTRKRSKTPDAKR